jgi:hypothetical protein
MNPMRPGRRRWLARAGALGAVGLLSACASLTASQTRALLAQPPADLPARVEWTQVPFFPQEINQCGPAALATALGAVGVPIAPEVLGTAVFVPAREGSLQIEMLAAPRRHGHIATRIRPDLVSLLREVAAGQAPVVLLNLGLSIQPLWHYAVVVGYDLPAGEILLRSGTVQREVTPLSTFEHTWSRSSQWAFVVLPPDRLPAQADEAAVTEARIAFERVAPAPQAALAYRTAWQRWPDSLLLGLGLGNTLYAAGELPEAEAAYARVAQRHDSAPSWHNLARVRLERRDLTGAHTAAEAAVRRAQVETNWRDAADAVWREVQQARQGATARPQP